MKFFGIFFALFIFCAFVPSNCFIFFGCESEEEYDLFFGSEKDEEIVGIMKDFFEQYNTMSGPGYDAIAQLGYVSEGAAQLLKFTGPVSALIAAGLKMTFPPRSPELKALRFLHKRMMRKFDAQNALLNGIVSKIERAVLLNDYETRITIPLKGIDRILEKITAPKENRSEWEGLFRKECAYDNPTSPLKMLDYMHTRINTNCKQHTKPDDVEAQNEIFIHCRAIFKNYSSYFEAINSEVELAITLAKLEKFPIVEQRKLVRKIKDAFEQEMNQPEEKLFGNIVMQKINPLFEAINDTELCLLRVLYEANEQQRRSLERFSEIVQIHLQHIAVISSYCANTTYNGSGPLIYWQSNETAKFFESTGTNATLWMNNELKHSWPQIIMDSAKNTITEDVSDPYQYNSTALKIWHAISKRGPRNFMYQVLVTHNMDEIAKFWFIGCPSNSCAIAKNHHLINIVISRHQNDAYLRTMQSQKWLANSMTNITAIIDANDKVPDLGTLAKLIENGVGPLISDSLFHSVILLHQSAWKEKNTEIPVGLVSTYDLGTNSHGYINRHIHHDFKNDERFKILFFV